MESKSGIKCLISRTSAAAAAQMRSVYNPAGMPGSGGHYGVMGRTQDHRGSMFGSSLNLNGKYLTYIQLLLFFIRHGSNNVICVPFQLY